MNDFLSTPFSSAEVAAHNRPDDCWVVVHDVVYNVTPFLAHHPGGPQVILMNRTADGDATAAFEAIGHSPSARQLLETMRVGVLATGKPAAQQLRAGGPRLRTATGGFVGLNAIVAIPCATCGAALPDGSDVCVSCQQPSARQTARQQLQLAGRTLETGEEVDVPLAVTPAKTAETAALALPQPAGPPGMPGMWKPAGTGDWQANCAICAEGGIMGMRKARLQPDEAFEDAIKKGDAAARRGEWAEALFYNHEAIGLVRHGRTPAATIGALRAAASTTQRRLGSMRSALRHSDAGVKACATHSPVHAARGAALEALGLIGDAHAAYAEAARLEPSEPSHAAAATRLLPLHAMLVSLGTGDGGGGGDCGDGPPNAPPLQPLPPPQQQLAEQLRRSVAANGLAQHLLPLPTPKQVLSDDEFNSSAWRVRQLRLLALLGVDAAVGAARGVLGAAEPDAAAAGTGAGTGTGAAAAAAQAPPPWGAQVTCPGVREWLMRKALELGLDVTAELVSAALDIDGDDGPGDGGSEFEASDNDDDDGSGRGDGGGSDDDDDDDDGTMVSGEVEAGGGFGRVLVQFELAPLKQRLTLSLVSLDSAALGESVLRYTFAVGLASACLLHAESDALGLPHMEFAEWHAAERGALVPPEGLPPAASVDRRARAFTGFFSHGEGSRPPIAPGDMPAAGSFCAVVGE